MTFEAGTEAARCLVCDGVLRTPARRGRPRLTCSNRCRKAYNRSMRGQPRVTRSRSRNADPGEIQYREPPRPPEGYQSSLADQRFYAQHAQVEMQAKPWTQEELLAIDEMRRNPGVAHPLVVQRWIEAEAERRRRDHMAYNQALRPEDPLVPDSVGHLAIRANASRQANRRRTDPRTAMLRPVQPGPHPDDYDSNECITAPWSRGRW